MGRVERFVLDYLKEYDRGWGYAESIAERYAELNNVKKDTALVSVKRAIKNLEKKADVQTAYRGGECFEGRGKLVAILPGVKVIGLKYDKLKDYSKVPELVYQYLLEQKEGEPIYFSLFDIAEYISEKLGERFTYRNEIYEKSHMGYHKTRTIRSVSVRGFGNKIRETLYDFHNRGLIFIREKPTATKRVKIEMIYRTDRFYG